MRQRVPFTCYALTDLAPYANGIRRNPETTLPSSSCGRVSPYPALRSRNIDHTSSTLTSPTGFMPSDSASAQMVSRLTS